MIASAAILAAIVSEALAVYVLAELFAAGHDEGAQQAIGAVFFIAAGLAAFTLPRAIEFGGVPERWARLVTAAVSFIVIFGILRIEFHGDVAFWDLSWAANFVRSAEGTLRGSTPILLGFLLLTGLWVRTTLRATNEVELEGLAKSVGLPFIAVTACLVLAVYTSRTGEVARAGAAYYAVALISLAGAQLSLSGATIGNLRAGGTTSVLVAGTVGATVACVVVFWLVFGVVGPIIGPPLGTAVNAVLFAILYPPAWLIEQLFRLLFDGQPPQAFLELGDTVTETRDAANGKEADDGTSPSAAAGYGFRALALLVFAGALLLLFRWLTRLRSRSARRRADGEAVSITGVFREDMANLLHSFGRHGGRKRDIPASAAIRLYAAVLAGAESQGAPRKPGETPEEYAPRLKTVTGKPVTDEITAAFEQARYAGREPDPAVIAELERRWEEAR
ncbi:MAG: DUF4129 domain-containing protein [Dehalococcoidia bacterium]